MSSLPESLVRFRGELEDAIRRDGKPGAAASPNGWGARVLRAVKRRPGRTALAIAAVAGVAVAALFVSTPWHSPPGFLEKAEAALAPPPGTVLHMKVRMTEDRPECSAIVTHPPIEYWIDLTPPHNWRAFEVKQTDICKAGTSIEVGGVASSRKPTLVFRPPNTLETTPEWPSDPSSQLDPVPALRQALEEGRAHDEGRTLLNGRTVERIRVDCDQTRFPNCPPLYTYVDPETFYPVRTESGNGRVGRFSQDYETYEYLPGTRTNRALADIRAQHPGAKGP